MLRIFYLLLLLCPVLQSSAQFRIEGTIQDSISGAYLEDVNIGVEGLLFHGTITDAQGAFSITVDRLPVTLIVSIIGFETKKVLVSNETPVSILLNQYATDLPEIIVRAAPKVDTVYHEPYNVVDYVFQDDRLILLVFINNFKKYDLVLLDAEENYVDHISLKECKPSSLFKDCRDEVYVTTVNGVYPIESKPSSIELGHWVNQQEYDQVIKPCVLSVDSILLYQRYFYQGQALKYYAFKNMMTRKDSVKILPLIEDEANIIRLVEETGNQLPWSGDFWEENISNRLRTVREAPYFLVGKLRAFFPKIYAPVVRKGKMICLFNHMNSKIQYFNTKGEQLREVPIRYHKIKRWKKYILYDELTEEVYTAFHTRWGEYICRIDLETGELSKAIPLDRALIEKVSIRNGVLYFIHRNPYQGAQNRMIQKLRVFP